MTAAELAEANKAVALRLMEEVFRQAKVEVLDEIFAEDAEYEGPPPRFMKGRAGFRQAVIDVHQSFEGWGPNIQDIVADGDLVVVRAYLEGLHVGEWGAMPPSGRRISYPIMHMMEIHDGVVTRYLDSRDEVAMWTEFGSVPSFLQPFLGGNGSAGGPPHPGRAGGRPHGRAGRGAGPQTPSHSAAPPGEATEPS